VNTTTIPDKAFGYEVRVTFNNGNPPEILHCQKKYAKAARRWAMLKINVHTAVVIDSYTKVEWERVWGINQRM
jgi:hypothetical protein